MPKNYKCLVTSDSFTFLEHIKNIDERIYTIEGKISHIDFENSNKEEILKMFVDQNMIMGAKKVFLFKTEDMYKSGFSKLAARLGGKKFIYHKF